MISLFKITLKKQVEVLSSVPKCRKAMMGLTMKVHMYGTLHSGTSYNAAGHEFSVNE